MATKIELENTVKEIFELQENCDGGQRVAMQDTLDEIRELCIEALPDLENEDADGDGIPDEAETDDENNKD